VYFGMMRCRSKSRLERLRIRVGAKGFCEEVPWLADSRRDRIR
jgi:hypothetical protein